jgi:superfamily II DNA or RNA helicase
VSALEKRSDRKEFLVYDVFGAIAHEVAQADLVRRGRVHEVLVRVVPTTFDAPWYRALRESVRTGGAMPLDAFDRLLEQMMLDAERNEVAVRIAVEHVQAGEPAIMFSHRRQHCRRLDADASAHGVRTGCLLGGKDDSEEFERVVRGMRVREVMIGCGTYQAVGEGIDLPAVSAGVCVTPFANSRDGRAAWDQVKGRLARVAEGKSGATITYLLDRAIYGVAPVQNLARWNRDVVVLDGGDWVPAKVWLKLQKEAEDATAK